MAKCVATFRFLNVFEQTQATEVVDLQRVEYGIEEADTCRTIYDNIYLLIEDLSVFFVHAESSHEEVTTERGNFSFPAFSHRWISNEIRFENFVFENFIKTL